ncbi:MAG: hypothetical protein GKS06_12885 [Acidobacteria bacterium]|nr:hypothetical protein [Acidobacteriota bacterium]
MSRHLQEFRWSADSDEPRFDYMARIPIGMSPEDLCRVGEGQYVAQAIRFATREAAMNPGRFPPHALHFVTLDGAETSSFGAVYAADVTGINLAMTFGELRCAPRAATIAYTLETGLGETHLFAAEGHRRAIVRYVDIMPMEVQQVSEGRTTHRVPDAEYHVLESSTMVPEGWLLLHFVHKVRSEFGLESQGTLTYVVDVAAPAAYYIDEGLPAVIAQRGTLAVSVQREPFPQLQVWRTAR